MVRRYQKNTHRGEWNKGSMQQAVNDALEKKIGYRQAATFYNILRSTLQRRIKTIRKGEMNLVEPLGPIQPLFLPEKEEEIRHYLKYMEARLFGLNCTEVRQLPYQMAIKNEVTSAARASGFNKPTVNAFLDLVGQVYDKNNLTPDRIYNCDEAVTSTASKSKCKIIAQKGKKQVRSLSSAERGQPVTVEICVTAAGTFLPPLFIFRRKKGEGTTAKWHASGFLGSLQ